MSTIFLAGVYGVGKSTIGEKISSSTGIPYYSAGELISEINGEKYGANKTVTDKNKNQNILVKRVDKLLQEYSTIILAGHFCIINCQNQVETLPESIFAKLKLKKIILLETDIYTIQFHIAKRDKKKYPLGLIQNLIAQEHKSAIYIAQHIDSPLVIHRMKYSNEEIFELIENL